jgi:hypothetical protein
VTKPRIYSPNYSNEFLGLINLEVEQENLRNKYAQAYLDLPVDADKEIRKRVYNKFANLVKKHMVIYIQACQSVPVKKRTDGIKLLLKVVKFEKSWNDYWEGRIGWTPQMHRKAFKTIERLTDQLFSKFVGDIDVYGIGGNSMDTPENLLMEVQLRYMVGRLAVISDQLYRESLENVLEWMQNKQRDPKNHSRMRYHQHLSFGREW